MGRQEKTGITWLVELANLQPAKLNGLDDESAVKLLRDPESVKHDGYYESIAVGSDDPA